MDNLLFSSGMYGDTLTLRLHNLDGFIGASDMVFLVSRVLVNVNYVYMLV